MRRYGSLYAPVFLILWTLVAGWAFAQTYYWNPSAPLINSGAEAQKAYNWTSGNSGSGTNPKSILDDDFGGTLSAWKTLDSTRATGSAKAVISITSGKLSVAARGKDVWLEDNQYAAAYRTYRGDFDISVAVDSQTNTNPWAKAGIMVMDTLANPAGGGCYILAVTPQRGVHAQYDSSGAIGAIDWTSDTDVKPDTKYPVYLRLAKRGTAYYGFYRSRTDTAWTALSVAIPQNTNPDSVQVALFAASHDTSKTSTVLFDDFMGGGDIAPAAIDLNIGGGKTATADSNARLMAPLSVRSLKFSGYDGIFDFRGATLTLTGDADFSGAAAVVPGTGVLAFGAGTQVLTPRAGAVFPALSKSGTGTLTLAGTLNAGKLSIGGGVVDLGPRNQAFAGLAATGGSLAGLGAGDTLSLSGNADFSGLAALPAAGAVLIGADSRSVAFTAGAAAFPDLILWPRPLTADARIEAGGPALKVAGKLVLRDEKVSAASGFHGDADFSVSNPDVALGGSVARADAGQAGGVSSIRLFMGKGTWTARADVSLILTAGLYADSATLDFPADGVQNLTIGAGVLGTIRHTGSGTLNLAQSGLPLKAGVFSQLSGTLNLNGSDLDITRDLSISNGTAVSILGLGGQELKAGGNISLAGTSSSRLGLNPDKAWKAAAGGALSADWADLKNGDAGASADSGLATANCNDLGGNVKWKFGDAKPYFVVQPAPVSALEGKPAVFRAAAGGSRPISYAWRQAGDTTVLSTADTLYFDSAKASQNGAKYQCTAYNPLDSVKSLEVLLTVNSPPSVLSQPADSAVLAGASVSFSVAAKGSGALQYAWKRTGDTATVWATTPTLAIVAVADSLDSASFACTVTNAFGSAVSRAAVLTLRHAPKITSQPGDTTVVAGQGARFSLSAAGTAPLTYAWTRKGSAAVLSTAPSLVLDTVKAADDGAAFVCTVGNAYGTAVSDTARLTVVIAAAIVREPTDLSVSPNRTAIFAAGVVGTGPLTYAWRIKGDTAVLSNDTLLQLDSVKLARDGQIFVFTVSNAYGADTSREARLTVVVCDSLFAVSADTLTLEEGQSAEVAGTARCASAHQWEVKEGPGPRILDPEVDTLAFSAPRVAADTQFILTYSARYAGGWVSRDVVVKVRETIPDPDFSLPAAGKWKGAATYAVRPVLLNKAALQAVPDAPPLHYRWTLSAAIADTAQGGDSLILSHPTQGGTLDITLCMDNGGAQACHAHSVEIDLATVRLAIGALRFGPARLNGRTLEWYADAAARIWDFRGRLLWQGGGRAGSAVLLPENAARDLLRGRARLEIFR